MPEGLRRVPDRWDRLTSSSWHHPASRLYRSRMNNRPMQGFVWFLLGAGLLAVTPAIAQGLSPLSPDVNAGLPQCGPAMDGQAMCRFGVIYECQFSNPNSMERRNGWRWKSDVLRTCERAPAPADLSDIGRPDLPP